MSDRARQFRLKSLFFLLGCLFGGGLFFWLPSIVLHFWRGQSFWRVDVLVLTVVLPAFAAASAIAVKRFWRSDRPRSFAPLAIFLGIWLLGPAATFLDATWSGGGFTKAGAWGNLLLLTAIFPAGTFIGSAYDGSLLGLLIASVILIAMLLRNLQMNKRGAVRRRVDLMLRPENSKHSLA